MCALYGEESPKLPMNNNLILFGGNGVNGGNSSSRLGLYNGFTIDNEKLLEINILTQGNDGNAGNGVINGKSGKNGS